MAFVKHFSYRDKLVAAESAPSSDGLKNWPGDISSDIVPPIFIDLRRLVSPDDVFTSQVVCNDIEPFGEEVARLTGSTIVGLGGGPHLQLWIDGKLVYTNVNFSAQRSILHSLVELDSPITSETQIRLRVCSPESSAYLAASLSLWTKKLLQETCSQRKGKDFDYVPKDNAQKTEKSSIECLAPIVGRQEPN